MADGDWRDAEREMAEWSGVHNLAPHFQSALALLCVLSMNAFELSSYLLTVNLYLIYLSGFCFLVMNVFL